LACFWHRAASSTTGGTGETPLPDPQPEPQPVDELDISAAVEGYDLDQTLDVVGIALLESDGPTMLAGDLVTTVSGTIHPAPNARVDARLVEPSEIPGDALRDADSFFCDEVTATPGDARIHLDSFLYVQDNTDLDAPPAGFLVLLDTGATFSDDPEQGLTLDDGDSLWAFMLSDRAVALTGACVFSDGEYVEEYDLQLQAGWNVLRLEAVEAEGDVYRYDVRVAPLSESVTWQYSSYGDIAVAPGFLNR